MYESLSLRWWWRCIGCTLNYVCAFALLLFLICYRFRVCVFLFGCGLVVCGFVRCEGMQYLSVHGGFSPQLCISILCARCSTSFYGFIISFCNKLYAHPSAQEIS